MTGQQPIHRTVCPQCRKAAVACYCKALRPFFAPFSVGILQHPYEARNAIATGRMTHLSVENSVLFVDKDFSDHRGLNALLADKTLRHVILYPSSNAAELDVCFNESAPLDHRRLFFWILDAKWQHVNQIMRLSKNLHSIPMVKFNPDRESQFIIRKQPKPICLSTIEAVHLVIDRYYAYKGLPNREHSALLDVFQFLVQQQLEFAKTMGNFRHIRNRRIREAFKNADKHLSCGHFESLAPQECRSMENR